MTKPGQSQEEAPAQSHVEVSQQGWIDQLADWQVRLLATFITGVIITGIVLLLSLLVFAE